MKKILAMMLSAVLMFGTTTVLAEWYDDGPYWTPFSYTITVDGTEVPSEPGYNGDYYRYTSIAEALGYETSFLAETGMVESKKGDITFTFSANGYGGATVLEGGKQVYQTYFFLIQPIDDKTYISAYSAAELAMFSGASLFTDPSSGNVLIYTDAGKQALAKQVDARTTIWNEMLNLVKDKDYTSKGTGSITMNLSSNLFGLSGTGSIDLTMNMVKSKGKTYTKITTANSGLFHLLHIFSTADEPVFTPETFELYNDGTQIYVKGEALISSLLEENGYNQFSYYFKDELQDLTKKWVIDDHLPISLALLSGNITLGEYIVKSSFESGGIAGDALCNIDLLTALFADENVAVSEHDGLKTYTYTIDKDMYLRCMEPLLSGLSSGERTDFDNVMNGFEMSISVTQHVSEDGITAVSDGKISLSNVPNPWNEDVFSGEILFSFDEQADFSVSSDFVFPDVSDAVNLLDYMRDLVDADIFAR